MTKHVGDLVLRSNYTQLNQTEHKKVEHIASNRGNKAKGAKVNATRTYLYTIHKYTAKGPGKQHDPCHNRTKAKTIKWSDRVLQSLMGKEKTKEGGEGEEEEEEVEDEDKEEEEVGKRGKGRRWWRWRQQWPREGRCENGRKRKWIIGFTWKNNAQAYKNIQNV